MYFLAIILGLVLGSFINALVYRLNARKPIFFDRSACPRCGHKLAANDLVPILSFAFLRGRCRYCRGRISWQYPVVELAAAALLVLVYRHFSPDMFAVFGYSVLSLILLIIFLYDWKHFLVLDSVTLPAIVFALIFNFLRGENILYLLLATAAGGGFFLAQYLISRGRWLGGGDIRIGALAGAILGWPGVVLSIIIAYILGAAVCVPFLIAGKAKGKTPIPFGTFLTVAIFIFILWGGRLIRLFWIY